jgi:hypothetical protein
MDTELVEQIAAKSSVLPVELQHKAPEYVESLVQETTSQKKTKPFLSVKGTIQTNLNNPEKDLGEIRAEMWQNFPREEPK